MSRNRELPFSKSPERILEDEEEQRPRQLAYDIYTRFKAHERKEQIERTVPERWRNMVRRHIEIWSEREAKLLEGRAAK